MSLFGPPVLVAFQRCNIGPNKTNKSTNFISSGFYKKVSGSSSILSPHTKIIDSAKSKIENVTLGAQKSDITGMQSDYSNKQFKTPQALTPTNIYNKINKSLQDSSSGYDNIMINSNYIEPLKPENVEQNSSLNDNNFKNRNYDNVVLNLEIKLLNPKDFANVFKEAQLDTKVSAEETSAIVPSSSSPDTTYEESIDKIRKKFIKSAFNAAKSKKGANLKNKYLKPINQNKPYKEAENSLDKKKPRGGLRAPGLVSESSGIIESDQNELYQYLEKKYFPKRNDFKKTKSLNAPTLNSKDISKEKHEGSKISDLIDKYILENYDQLSQYYLDIIHVPGRSPENNKKIGETKKHIVSADKIPSFPLMNKKKEGFTTTKEGILNIDLLSNPLLRDRYAGIPSVTKILNDTMSEASAEALRRWKQKMIASMGEEKFEAYYKAQMSRGKDFHNKVKDYLMGKSDIQNVDPEVSTSFKSLNWVLKDITNVAAVESFVVHPNLGYKGILDCIAKYKEKPVLIEWKLANKKKSAIASTYDAPLQLCAYLGALNFDKNYNLQVQGGLLVIAHTDGSVADTFEVSMDDCQKFWSQWLSRLEKYYLTSSQQ